jgi:hypothetical protein
MYITADILSKRPFGAIVAPQHNLYNNCELVAAIDMRIVSRPPPPLFPNVQTVFHLNWLSVLPSYEGRVAVEGVKWYFCFWPP